MQEYDHQNTLEHFPRLTEEESQALDTWKASSDVLEFRKFFIKMGDGKMLNAIASNMYNHQIYKEEVVTEVIKDVRNDLNFTYEMMAIKAQADISQKQEKKKKANRAILKSLGPDIISFIIIVLSLIPIIPSDSVDRSSFILAKNPSIQNQSTQNPSLLNQSHPYQSHLTQQLSIDHCLITKSIIFVPQFSGKYLYSVNCSSASQKASFILQNTQARSNFIASLVSLTVILIITVIWFKVNISRRLWNCVFAQSISQDKHALKKLSIFAKIRSSNHIFEGQSSKFRINKANLLTYKAAIQNNAMNKRDILIWNDDPFTIRYALMISTVEQRKFYLSAIDFLIQDCKEDQPSQLSNIKNQIKQFTKILEQLENQLLKQTPPIKAEQTLEEQEEMQSQKRKKHQQKKPFVAGCATVGFLTIMVTAIFTVFFCFDGLRLQFTITKIQNSDNNTQLPQTGCQIFNSTFINWKASKQLYQISPPQNKTEGFSEISIINKKYGALLICSIFSLCVMVIFGFVWVHLQYQSIKKLLCQNCFCKGSNDDALFESSPKATELNPNDQPESCKNPQHVPLET